MLLLYPKQGWRSNEKVLMTTISTSLRGYPPFKKYYNRNKCIASHLNANALLNV